MPRVVKWGIPQAWPFAAIVADADYKGIALAEVATVEETLEDRTPRLGGLLLVQLVEIPTAGGIGDRAQQKYRGD